MTWTPEELESGRVDAYGGGNGTHVPLLASVVAVARPGAVIEIGTGHSSAPLLAEMCANMGRMWHVVDSMMHWVDATYDLEPYAATQSADMRSALEVVSDVAVAFVDSSEPLNRLRAVHAVRPLAEFIVIHDTDNQSGDLDELIQYLGTFRYRYTYKRMRPWTTVVSDVRPYPGGNDAHA